MEEIMAKNIGRAKYIKKARRERAWSQSQLATIADVNLRTIQRIEKDGAASFDTLRGIAQAFEIDVKELDPASESNNPKSKFSPPKPVHFMPRLASGRSLTEVVVGADQFQFEHDEDNDLRSIGAMKDILKLLQGDVLRLYDADPIKRLTIEAELSQELTGLEKYGYYIFGIKRMIPKANAELTQVTMCTLFMSHSRSPKIVRDKKLNMMMPAILPEVAQ